MYAKQDIDCIHYIVNHSVESLQMRCLTQSFCTIVEFDITASYL